MPINQQGPHRQSAHSTGLISFLRRCSLLAGLLIPQRPSWFCGTGRKPRHFSAHSREKSPDTAMRQMSHSCLSNAWNPNPSPSPLLRFLKQAPEMAFLF